MRRYFSCMSLRKFSTLAKIAVRLVFFFSSRTLSTHTTRCISLNSMRMRVRVISVHLFSDFFGGGCFSKSTSSTLSGNWVSYSSLRIPGRGPCASHVRRSRKQSWYHISRRTWVSTGESPYSVPSRCRPMHSAIRMAVPQRAECARDISLRHNGI